MTPKFSEIQWFNMMEVILDGRASILAQLHPEDKELIEKMERYLNVIKNNKNGND